MRSPASTAVDDLVICIQCLLVIIARDHSKTRLYCAFRDVVEALDDMSSLGASERLSDAG